MRRLRRRMTILLFKLILTPLLIGAVSLVGRRWGPGVSGWLVGLPLTSGPIALFLALEQGTAFAAATAQSILVGLISVGAFCLAYSWLARSLAWVPALVASWGVVFVATALLDQFPVSLLPAFLGVVGTLLLVLRLLPDAQGARTVWAAPRWEIPLRMLVATLFVLALTGLAAALGPRLSGLLAPFPIFTTILAAFTHHFEGAGAIRPLLRGVVLGSFSFATFFLIIATTVERLGVPAAFLLATASALALHGTSLWVLRRGTATRAPGGRPADTEN